MASLAPMAAPHAQACARRASAARLAARVARLPSAARHSWRTWTPLRQGSRPRWARWRRGSRPGACCCRRPARTACRPACACRMRAACCRRGSRQPSSLPDREPAASRKPRRHAVWHVAVAAAAWLACKVLVAAVSGSAVQGGHCALKPGEQHCLSAANDPRNQGKCLEVLSTQDGLVVQSGARMRRRARGRTSRCRGSTWRAARWRRTRWCTWSASAPTWPSCAATQPPCAAWSSSARTASRASSWSSPGSSGPTRTARAPPRHLPALAAPLSVCLFTKGGPPR